MKKDHVLATVVGASVYHFVVHIWYRQYADQAFRDLIEGIFGDLSV